MTCGCYYCKYPGPPMELTAETRNILRDAVKNKNGYEDEMFLAKYVPVLLDALEDSEARASS